MDVLVLTQGYEPLEQISWERAIHKWMNGSAEVLEWTKDLVWSGLTEVAGQLRDKIFKPSVIRLLRTFSRKRAVKYSRENVYLRDKGKCQYCHVRVARKDSTIDHVTPRSQGGRTGWDNVVVACHDCNQKKRDRTPQQAKMRLRTAPIKPKSLPVVSGMAKILGSTPSEWRSYLYWNVELESD